MGLLSSLRILDSDHAAHGLAGLDGGSLARLDDLPVVSPHLIGGNHRAPSTGVAGLHETDTGLPKAGLADDMRRHAFGHMPARRQDAQDDAGQERPQQHPGEQAAACRP